MTHKQIEPQPKGLTGDTAQFVEITYRAILPVSAKANWFTGQMPRNLTELDAEVSARKIHGHEVTEQLTSAMSKTGKLGASGPVQRFTAGEFAAYQERIHAGRQDTSEGNWD